MVVSFRHHPTTMHTVIEEPSTSFWDVYGFARCCIVGS